LREGIIYDLLGRLSDDDVREQSVRQLCERFTVGALQAGRVWSVVQHLFAAAAPSWDLDGARDLLYLRWASSLHELGLAISHAGFHKHGAYVLAKADMHGFSRRDQWLLASLVRLHRGRLAQEVTADLPPPWDQRLLKLAVLLRLAVLLCRARQDAPGPNDVALTAAEQQVHLRLSPQWLRTHPLVAADLEAEAERWLKAGWALQWDAPDSES
jgi:exopolyphosphatase/guanosine-5'-triphosphate,3'-diphosphate pyrophosphatase